MRWPRRLTHGAPDSPLRDLQVTAALERLDSIQMTLEKKALIHYERDYYPCVARWFEAEKHCTSASVEHLFSGSTLLSADIVGWSNEDPIYACEMKPYPLPIGSSGYGSIGQALMLTHFAKYAYIGGIASERAELIRGQIVCWQKVLRMSSTKSLLNSLELKRPSDFSEFCDVAKALFQKFFGNLGIGFLIVHEKYASEDPLLACEVIELVEPRAF